MKVCFIDWFAYPLFNPKSKIVFGGAQIQLYLIAQELAKNKTWQISFLTDNQQKTQLEKINKINVFQLVRTPKTEGIKGRLLVGNWHFMIRLLFQLRKINAQVYFQRAASAESGLIGFICKLLHKKYIFMVAHEQDVNGDFIKQNGWQGQLFSLGLKLADKIICQTKEQQNQLSRLLRKKSVVIRSGHPIKPINQIKQKKQGILWVARAEEWKRPDLLIKIAIKFPQKKFTMICPPAENKLNYYEKIKSQAKKTKNITFIKQVPFEKIDTYFAKAKIFISTSENEGFPNTFIQAAKNMSPILSFKVNPDRIIDNYKVGFCAEGNEKKMMLLLKKLIEDSKLRQSLAKNAYLYAKKYHDIKQTAMNIKKNIFEPLIPTNKLVYI